MFSQPRSPSDGLHAPGDLGLRKPEHPRLATSACRPDGGEGLHGGGGDGHHRALSLGIGLRTDYRDAAAAVLPALHVAPGQRCGLGAPQSRVGEPGGQGYVELPPSLSLFRRYHPSRPLAWLDGGEADHGEDVGGEGPGLALRLRETPSPSFSKSAHARVPAG